MSFIVCVPWKDRGISSEQRKCALCEVDVALSTANVAKANKMQLSAICIACAIGLVADDDVPVMGGLVNGKVVPLNQASALAFAERNRN